MPCWSVQYKSGIKLIGFIPLVLRSCLIEFYLKNPIPDSSTYFVDISLYISLAQSIILYWFNI